MMYCMEVVDAAVRSGDDGGIVVDKQMGWRVWKLCSGGWVKKSRESWRAEGW